MRNWIWGAGALLLFLVGFFAWKQSITAPDLAQGFLQRQAAAMRPDHEAEWEGLTEIPRYQIRATVDPDSGEISGEMDLRFTNLSQDEIGQLAFRLYPNASSIYGGGSLTVTQATLAGNPLVQQTQQEGTVANIQLPQALPPGGSLEVSLAFQGQVPAGFSQGYGIFNRSRGVLTLAGWYPVLAPYAHGWLTPAVPLVGDAMRAALALYEVDLNLPQGYQVASTGAIVSSSPTSTPSPSLTRTGAENTDSSKSENWLHYRIVSGPAREFALAASQKFEVTETESNGVKLRYYALPAEKPLIQPQDALNMLADVFRIYQDVYGSYPYNEFELFEAPITIGGYEFSGMAMLDDGVRPQQGGADYRYLMAHELAHQWWYGLVGTPTVTEPWLDEAHASYSAVIYLERRRNPATAQQQVRIWKQEYGLRKANQPPVNSPATDFTGWLSYRRTVYMHGALFLDALRQQIGDERFFTILRTYQDTYRYKTGDTQTYLDAVRAGSGQDVEGLIETWFQTTHNTAQDNEG